MKGYFNSTFAIIDKSTSGNTWIATGSYSILLMNVKDHGGYVICLN